MKNYIKHIRFQNIQLKIQKEHPKDLSRVQFKIIQQSHEQHITKKYGTILPNQIKWQLPIQFKYLAQPLFKFQTFCQHQYGYQIQELKSLYFGQIKIKPQDFFHVNTFPIFNNKNQKCGKVSFLIKVVDRQLGNKFNKNDQIQNKEKIKVDLKGKITIYSANLMVSPTHIAQIQKIKAQKLTLQLKINGNYMKGIFIEPYKWNFKDAKLQLCQKTDPFIKIKINGNDQTLLQGKLQLQKIFKQKRFLTQSTQLKNQKGIKIATIQIDIRLFEKKEILDLMYSPKKLQDQKFNFQIFKKQNSLIQMTVKSSLQRDQIMYKKKLSYDNLKSKSNSLKNSRYNSPQNTPQKINNYELYLRKKYKEIKFPQSKRFLQTKSINQYVSYIDQNFLSDFYNKRKGVMANISKTQRTDFIKNIKNHPGIGQYNLPSIWSKY